MADFLSRERQTASASLKAQHGTETGKTQLNSVLRTLLNPEKRFTKDTKDWCKWLIAGGECPDEFLRKLRDYDSSQTCGLVWHKNFVAYRCRDCGTSPCMSICADCFHDGDHRGHDYNMFRSQAGGACDCGDENVMKKEGFCSSHGKQRSSMSHPPADALYMAKTVIPHLFNRLYKEVELQQNSDESILSGQGDVDEIVDFLQELGEGEVLRSIVCDVIVQECLDVNQSSHELRCVNSDQSSSSFQFLSATLSNDSVNGCGEHESTSFLDLLLDLVIKLDFPEKLVTFLLQLLPNQEYKVAFTRKFCQKYQEIGKLLTLCSTLHEVEQLSNSVVHISVQLFSNKALVTKMVQEQNLLHVMVKVLLEMMRTTLQPMKVNGQSVDHLVINCDKEVIKYHCYWPVISDFINIVTHHKIAFIFMKDSDLLEKWMNFVAYVTGMNCNERVVTEHIKYEPTTYNAAYFIEIEAASSPMWSLIAASSVLNDKTCVLNVIHHTSMALGRWQKKVAVQPSRAEVTFHLPLLRYFSAFVKQALLQFNMNFEEFEFDLGLLTKLLEWPTCIQAAACEIRAGMWTRNGNQIHAQSAWYHQCHFSNSMLDLDIFFLQICAAHLEPEYFLGVLIERFRVEHWFQFPSELELCSPGIDDDNKEMMVEGVLTLILTLLSSRLHCGMGVEETLRLEMVTLLCFSDRTHSQLVDLENTWRPTFHVLSLYALKKQANFVNFYASATKHEVPERYGQTVNAQLFDRILSEISDYKHPGCDSSGMQQGMYALKPEFWETHFDPVHALLRAFNRREFQSAMGRYSTHLRQHKSSYVTSAWPPFRPLTPVPNSLNGLFRLLHCKKLHRMLYLILYKATSNVTPLSESIMYLTVHLITLAVQSSATCFQMLPCPSQPSLSDVGDTGCVIATKCLQFLDQHGRSVKNLHENEDFSEINETLLSNLMCNPEMSLDVKLISVQDISLILGHVLHYRMEPSLFTTILPYMSTVLTNTLNNSRSHSERETQLQHIQHLLETLPAYRYYLAKRLIAYLIRYIEREQISMKNLSLICDDSQPVELTMLFTYLIKFHEKLFRVYPRTNGLPMDISLLEFPSNHLLDNIQHEPRISPELPSMLNFYSQVALEDMQDSVTSPCSLVNSDSSTDALVEEFMEVTHSSRDMAMCLLQKCEQNLQIAINVFLENSSSCAESTVSSNSCMLMDVDDVQNINAFPCPVVNTSSQCWDMESDEVTGNSDLTKCRTGEQPETPSDLMNSIISLLIKLKTILLMSVTSPVSPRCAGVTVVNDGVREVEQLLELICSLSSSNIEAVGKLETGKYSLSPTDDIEDPLVKQEKKKKRAQECRQRILDQLKNQQQKFFKSHCKDTSSDVDGGGSSHSQNSVELYDCAICNQNIPSTEQQPVGYVAFLQSGTVLKHRKRSDTSKPSNNGTSSSPPSSESFCCGSVYSARRKFLLTYFDKIKATQACELGIDGGVHIQSCGHCLHLKCHQRYLQTLKDEQTSSHRHQTYDVTKEEFKCPVCRRVGNAILPILPSDVMPSKCNKNKAMCHRETLCELKSTMSKFCNNNWSKLTTSALQPSVLSTSVTFLVDAINRLDLSKERENMTVSQHKFSLIVETARSNLEAEHIAIQAGKLSSARKHFYGTLLRTLQFQCQTLVRPLCHVFALLTGHTVELCGTDSGEDISVNDVPLLLKDCVCLLLQLVLSWPAPLSLRCFQCLIQIVFNVVLVQALVKMCCALTEDERTSWRVLAKRHKQGFGDAHLPTDVLLSNVCLYLADSKLCQATEECPGISQSVWSPHSVEATLQKYCLPFLRLVCSLSTLCYSTECSATQDDENEFYLLTKSLGLHNKTPPAFSISDCFQCSHESSSLTLIKTWCKQLRFVSRRHDSFPKDLFPGMDVWELPRLVELPERYCGLFQTYRKKSCKTCDTIPDEPTLCLVCGTFLCLRGKCCERQNTRECVRHAMECGYGTAIFLILMSSSVFVIRGEKASVWGSVYLDEFGEEDIDLRRGKPLFLCRDRYLKLQEQWITHNFDSICKTWVPHHNNL